jgi:AcrR family transcriptional regulator
MRGRKKSEATRAAILRCAAEIFSERPYHEVPIEDVSIRLGIGKGTLYRYFESKEELYFATIVDGLRGMGDAVKEVLQCNAPFQATIEELCRTVISYFWERRDFFVLLHRHESKLDPEERADWQKQREELVSMVGEILADEMRRRGANGINPRLAVEMLFGMIRAVCMYRDEADSVDNLARLVTGVFFAGVLPQRQVSTERRASRHALKTVRRELR